MQNFFQKFQENPCRGQQNPQKFANTGKNSLKGTQRGRAERQEIEHRCEPCRNKHIQPELPAPGQQCKQQQRHAERQRKQHIRRAGHAGAKPAQRAQQIIKQAQPDRQQRRLRELQRLRRDRQLHQPNRRAKKPPEACVSCS